MVPAVTAGAFTGISLAPRLGAPLAAVVGLAAFSAGEWISFAVVWLVVMRHGRLPRL